MLVGWVVDPLPGGSFIILHEEEDKFEIEKAESIRHRDETEVYSHTMDVSDC